MLAPRALTAFSGLLVLLPCGQGAVGEGVPAVSTTASPASTSGHLPSGMADVTPALSAFIVFDEAGEWSRLHGNSNWTLSYDVVTQTSNIHYGQYCSASQKGTILYAYSGVADYVWSVDVASEDDDALGIVFRFADTNNFYKYSHSNDEGGCRTLYKIRNGVRSELWRASSYTSYGHGRKYAFRVRTDGCRLVGHYQGDEDFDVTDPDCVPSGGVGVYSWANSAGRWSDMLLTTPWTAGTAAEAEAEVEEQGPGMDLALAAVFVVVGATLGACGAGALWCLAARRKRARAYGKFVDAGGRADQGGLPKVWGSPVAAPGANGKSLDVGGRSDQGDLPQV